MNQQDSYLAVDIHSISPTSLADLCFPLEHFNLNTDGAIYVLNSTKNT